jgi:hypothetical protein
MVGEWIWGVLIVASTGVAIHFLLKMMKSDLELTWKEFGFVMAFFMAIGLFGIISLFDYLAVKNLVTYKENWSGFETSANWERVTCSEDGFCTHTYDCHPYTVLEIYDCSYTDSKGNRVSQTCTRPVTKYHSCPYTKEEWSFSVDTSTGDSVQMAYRWFPTDPEQHRWRAWGDLWIPALPSYVSSGVPANWSAANERLQSHRPGAVTFRHEYPNYVLAANLSILHKYSDKIEEFKAANLLPDFRSNVLGDYTGDRVYLVGTQSQSMDEWRAASNLFNGALGLERQGDLHLVIVSAKQVNIDDADDYVGALAAYWQSDKFEKDALSKNGIIVVLATADDKTVAWARAATGMPSGNELLTLTLRDALQGLPLTPASIFGSPNASVLKKANKLTAEVHHTEGALEKVLFGPDGFTRVHMADYQYLHHEIKPTSEQIRWLYVTIFFVSILAWGIVAYAGPRSFHNWRR